MKNKPEAYLDVDLVTLAYHYLVKKARKTRKSYTIADLFEACELILQEAEKNIPKKKCMRFRFIDNHVEVYSKDLADILSHSPLSAIM